MKKIKMDVKESIQQQQIKAHTCVCTSSFLVWQHMYVHMAKYTQNSVTLIKNNLSKNPVLYPPWSTVGDLT